MFSLSRNAIKQSIHLFDIFIMQIQNGHHEMTEVIISSLIIEIVTILFHQTICFRYLIVYNKKDDTFDVTF